MTESFLYIFDKYGIDIGDHDIRRLFGPPISVSLQPYFATPEDVVEAVAEFRAHYKDRYLTGNSLYNGIADMLDALKARGYTLAVVTGKPDWSANNIIDHFGLRKYFDGVYGSDSLHAEKIEALTKALQAFNCPPDQAVMIGDRLYDLEAAMLARTGGIGILWGYGDRNELEAYENLFLASSPDEITRYFCG